MNDPIAVTQVMIDIEEDFKKVIEKHLGKEFILGGLTREQTAEKISTGIISCTLMMENLVALAIIQKLNSAPKGLKECQEFTNKLTSDLKSMLKDRMDSIVRGAMEHVAFEILTQVDPSATVQ